MRPLAVAVPLVLFAGTALLLGELRCFRRPGLADRVRPYTPLNAPGRSPRLSTDTIVEGLRPLAVEVATTVARFSGASEDVTVRLRRIHSSDDPASFRLRQLRGAGVALLLGAGASTLLALPLLLAVFATLGLPALAFLGAEQRLAAASDRWRRRVVTELPVVTEQLGMLLGAGWSLGAALHRLASRGTGACAADLRRVVARMGQGLSEVDALREWSSVVDVEPLGRLVSVLTLDREAVDLDRLVAQESRAMRRDAHRDLLEAIERRSQQVWIPVTVAALVPGVLLMGVPFVDALSLFTT